MYTLITYYMPNLKQTIAVTSTPLNIEGSVRTIHLQNLWIYPITIRLSESWSAVYWEGITLANQYDSISYDSSTAFLGVSSAIAVGGSSDLGIFYK